jgi:hypothetical protein
MPGGRYSRSENEARGGPPTGVCFLQMRIGGTPINEVVASESGRNAAC